MGTRNFTSVILNGEQKVCQYCQWDGYPTYTGAKILELLRDVDMEKFKQAIENTKINLTNWEDAQYYTGSTLKTGDLYELVWQRQSKLNAERKTDDECYGTYKTVQVMVEEGSLGEQEAENYIVSTRDTGCDILSYIYERSLDKAPLQLFAFDDEYNDVRDYALIPGTGVPGCDAQGYYIIDLDKNLIKMTFDDYTQEYDLNKLPTNIDKEMLVFEKTTYKMYELEHADEGNFCPAEEDEKGFGGLWDQAGEIALKIGLEIKEEHPEVLENPDEPVYAEDFGQEYIYGLLCEEAIKQYEKQDHIDKVITNATFASQAHDKSVKVDFSVDKPHELD